MLLKISHQIARVMPLRIVVIVVSLFFVFLYACYQRGFFYGSSKNKESYGVLLEELPDFEFDQLQSGIKFRRDDLLKDPIYSQGPVFIHFWGTWCAPCVTEFPLLLDFLKNFQSKFPEKFKQSVFIIVAVNDLSHDVIRFLAKTKKRELESFSNILWVIDPESKSMEKFGSVKVPETYYFDKQKRTTQKFLGPQDWANPYFLNQYSSLF